jgi:hypothetical protein
MVMQFVYRTEVEGVWFLKEVKPDKTPVRD